MDNVDSRTTPPVVDFVPDRRFTCASAAGAVLAVLVAIVADDGPGRLIAGLAAALLLSYAASDLVFSPRLTASADGLRINAPLSRTSVGWAEVEAVRADTRARLGLRSTTLEIDAGATLVVFSRRSLGCDPADAAALILSCRPGPLSWER